MVDADLWYQRWMAGRQRVVERALDDLPCTPSGVVLDVASGDGTFTSQVAARTGGFAVAQDWGARECEMAKNAGCRAVRGDTRRLPFGDETADVTVAFEIIEHVDGYEATAVVDELHRVTKRGGTLLLSTPNRLALESLKGVARYMINGTVWNARDDTHVKLYSKRELVSLLRRRFDVQRVYGYYLTTGPRERPLPGTYLVTANRLLSQVCFILLVVARKRDAASP